MDDEFFDEDESVIYVKAHPNSTMLVPKIVLTYKESDLYMRSQTYTRGTSDNTAGNFWKELRKRKSYKDWHNGSIFVLDIDFVKENINNEDRLFAQVLWNMLDEEDSESKLYLKMKWNFQ